MKGNISDEKLIAFLYGEITPEERIEVEEYLKDNPEKQQEIEALGNLRETLGKWKDHENIEEPEITLQGITGRYSSLWYKLAVAASIALLITVGWIGYKSNDQAAPPQENFASAAQLQKLIEHQEKLTAQNQELLQKVAELEDQMGLISVEQKDQQTMLASMNSPDKNLKDDLLDKYVTNLQEQNRLILEQNFKTMNEQQQQYVHALLADFGNFITMQQQKDMEVIQARLQHLEQNTGEVQYAAAQLIARLNNTQLQQENY